MIGESVDASIKFLYGLLAAVITLGAILIYELITTKELDNNYIVNWKEVSCETEEITLGKNTYEILVKTYMKGVKTCKYCNSVIENK